MIVLHLSLPVSKNARHMAVKCGRFHKMVRTKACRLKEEALVAEVWSQIGGKPDAAIFSKPVSMSWTATFPDRRKRDLQNYVESLADVLQAAKVLEDDSLIVHETSEALPNYERPGYVKVELREIP